MLKEETNQNLGDLSLFPSEMIAHILSFLDFKDMVAVSHTNQSLRHLMLTKKIEKNVMLCLPSSIQAYKPNTLKEVYCHLDHYFRQKKEREEMRKEKKKYKEKIQRKTQYLTQHSIFKPDGRLDFFTGFCYSSGHCSILLNIIYFVALMWIGVVIAAFLSRSDAVEKGMVVGVGLAGGALAYGFSSVCCFFAYKKTRAVERRIEELNREEHGLQLV